MHHFHTPQKTFLAVDPRVKLLAAAALLVMVLTAPSPLFPALVAALSLAVCGSAGIRGKRLALRYAEPLFIAAVILLLKLLFAGKIPLFSFQLLGMEITGYRDGLQEGVVIAARIVGAVSVVSVVAFSTEFTELMAALSWLRVPRGLTETTMFAWRWLFLLHEDARVIHAAQKTRLGYAGYRRGLSSFGTLAGALVIKAFDGSQAMTTAMVQRGYDGDLPLLRHKPFRFREILVSAVFLAVMGAAWNWA